MEELGRRIPRLNPVENGSALRQTFIVVAACVRRPVDARSRGDDETPMVDAMSSRQALFPYAYGLNGGPPSADATRSWMEGRDGA
jgi:hypothetical protein